MKRVNLDINELKTLIDKGLIINKIADKMNVKPSYIHFKMRKLGLKSKSQVKRTLVERQNISLKLREYYKKNPDKHPWRNNEKFKSVPCEKLKDWLRSKNINFVEEFQPQIKNRNFSIDIAFPDKLVGLEINGINIMINRGI